MAKMGPLLTEHPLVGDKCPACHRLFQAGDWVTLIPLGPGSNPESQRKCREGQAYNAVAAPVHWSCATGELE